MFPSFYIAVENGVKFLLEDLKKCKTKKGWRTGGNVKEFFGCIKQTTGPVFYCKKKSPMFNIDQYEYVRFFFYPYYIKVY